MAFWREHMPAGMFLRSGPDWHLDACGRHTLEAYLQERAIAAESIDPIPIRLFLDYCEWFQREKGVEICEQLVCDLVTTEGGFRATLSGGQRIDAGAVVCAPGIRHYAQLPEWAAAVPCGRAHHTCDLVRFDDFAGARVLIVGGRQSAYEWAALIREHGAERIDVVHRHDLPRFERVNWKFVDADVQRTIDIPGYWRNLPAHDRDAITRRFWEAGRLTLEYWLTPRLDWDGLHCWPGGEVVEAAAASGGGLRVVLSNAQRLTVDRVVFATGYRADVARVPYLRGVIDRIGRADGFPLLDEVFGTTVPGLSITGFSATRDFGPFFGFVKGCPAAATLIVGDLLSRR